MAEAKPKYREKWLSIQTTKLVPKVDQPREEFDDEALDELGQSMKETGQIVPLIVRQVNSRYEICAGERRFRAAMKVGIKSLNCLVVDEVDDPKMVLLISAIENLQRENLKDTELEQSMFNLYNEGKNGWTHADIGKMVGKSVEWVRDKIYNHKDRMNMRSSSTTTLRQRADTASGTALKETRVIKDADVRDKILSKPDMATQMRERIIKAKKIEEVERADPEAGEALKKAYLDDEVDEDDIEVVADAVAKAKAFRPEKVEYVAKGAVEEVRHQKAGEKATAKAIERGRTIMKKGLEAEATGVKVVPAEVEVVLGAHLKVVNRLQGVLKTLLWELDVTVINSMPEPLQKRTKVILDEINKVMDTRMAKIEWK